MNDILREIVAVKHEEIAVARSARPLASLRREAEGLGGQRDFVGAMRSRMVLIHASKISAAAVGVFALKKAISSAIQRSS